MNHLPFENWLLNDELLDPPKKRELDAHLRSCDVCSAIAESNLALRSARVVGPAPGFSERFQERLVVARRAQRRRTLAGSLFFSLGGIILLAALAGPTLLSILGSPAEWISTMIQAGLFIYSSVVAVLEASSVIVRVVPGFMPPFLWLVILSTFSGLGLLWSISIWRLMRRPQGVQI